MFLSGDLASTKQFVQKVKQAFPNAAAARRQHRRARPGAAGAASRARSRTRTTGIITAGGLSPQEYDASDELEVLRRDLPGRDRQGRPRTPTQTIKTKDGKIDDTYGTINDACQTLTMFHDIGERVGQYLNNTNWVNTVDHFGPIDEPGLGPVLVAARGQVLRRRQLAAPGVRLRPSATDGHWKPITPLENITG